MTFLVNQVQLDQNNKDHALEIDHGARNLHNNSRSIDTKVSKYIVSNIMMIRWWLFPWKGVESSQWCGKSRRNAKYSGDLGKSQYEEHPGVSRWALFKVTTITDVTFKAPVPDHSDCRLKWTIWSPPGQYPGFLIIAIYNVPTNFPSYIFTSPTSNIPANAILFRASHMQQHWDQTNKAFQVLNIVNAGTTPSSC